MKICNHCKVEKIFTDFGNNKRMLDGKQPTCKKCAVKQSRKNQRTKGGLITAIYSRQVHSSKKRGHKLPEYTRQWLKDFILNSDEFHTLYDEWVASGYDRMLSPSIDRLDNSIGYTKLNIEIVTWGVNDRRYKDDKGREVDMLSMSGEYIKTFRNSRRAMVETGVNDGSIHHVLNGKVNHAGGYLWKYSA